MISPAGMIGALLTVAAAASLFALKDEVQRAEQNLHRLRAAVVAERDRMDRLRTEWAMLTQPGRLARLAQAHLELDPVLPVQIVETADLPLEMELRLAGQTWTAPLPSGAEGLLRLKPQQGLAAVTAAALGDGATP